MTTFLSCNRAFTTQESDVSTGRNDGYYGGASQCADHVQKQLMQASLLSIFNCFVQA